MKKLIILMILILGSALYAQSNTDKKEAATVTTAPAASPSSQKWADAYKQTKNELDEALRLIGEHTMQIKKMQNLLNDTRAVLIELAKAKTIEERDMVLKKNKLEGLNGKRDGGASQGGGALGQH